MDAVSCVRRERLACRLQGAGDRQTADTELEQALLAPQNDLRIVWRARGFTTGR